MQQLLEQFRLFKSLNTYSTIAMRIMQKTFIDSTNDVVKDAPMRRKLYTNDSQI